MHGSSVGSVSMLNQSRGTGSKAPSFEYFKVSNRRASITIRAQVGQVKFSYVNGVDGLFQHEKGVSISIIP